MAININIENPDIFSGPKPDDNLLKKDKRLEEGGEIINSLLKRLVSYYTHQDVEEIVINRPGEVWLRRRRPKKGEDIWNALADPELTFGYLERVCKIIANTNGMPFGNGPGKVPAIYASLPGGHRFSAAMYGNIVYDEQTPQGGVAMAIRQAPRSDSVINYDAYGLVRGAQVEAPELFKDMVDDSKDSLSKLKNAINRGSHLIVSGATSTGKTTLLNKIISELDHKMRVATVEDTRELVVPHQNRFHILLSRTNQTNEFDDARAIDFLTRMTPDVIICGEVSTQNASTIYELTGSGHGSMMTTIHAESPEQALNTFMDRMEHENKNLNRELVLENMKSRFTVVQINRRHDGSRHITAIETFT